MQTVKIALVETTTGKMTDGKDWAKYTLTTEDGSKASGFDKNLAKVKQGDTIEWEIELKGKYTNIKEWKLVMAAPPVTGSQEGIKDLPEKKQPSTETPDIRLSIESQKRADIIAQCWMAGKLKDDDFLVAKLKKWLSYLLLGEEIGAKSVIVPPTLEQKALIDEVYGEEKPKTSTGGKGSSPPITEAMLRTINADAAKMKYTSPELSALVKHAYGLDDLHGLTVANGNALLAMISRGEKAPEEEEDIPF